MPQDAPVEFTVKYLPYQLYPDAPQEGEDKYAWYQKSRYGDSDEKMKMYTTLMSAYGVAEGIDFHFDGIVANTMHAHRVVQHFQRAKGITTANALVESLYRQYFEQEQHPSSGETLLKATADAGIAEAEARSIIIDNEDEGLAEVRLLMREQAGNGIDAVPHLVFIGRRRDITLEGCREVGEYTRALQSIIKESL